MATQGVSTVRGINHYAALANNIRRLNNQTMLGVFGVNLKKLSHEILPPTKR
jgi:hypothetical protein